MTFYISNKLKRKLASVHSNVPEEKQLGFEILEILFTYYLFKQQKPDNDDALSNLITLRYINLLSNDIILRLCKFRDKDSRSLSFAQVKKKLEKKPKNKSRLQTTDEKITQYRTLTTNLASHRDSYIAHYAKRDRTHLRPPTEILPAIRMAVDIVDDLSGEINAYTLESIDLRTEVLGGSAI